MMPTTARPARVYDQRNGRWATIPAGTDSATLTAGQLQQMNRTTLWTGGTLPAGVTPALVPLKVYGTTAAVYNGMVTAGTARTDALYVY